MRLGFRFSRDISRRAKWCLLERVGGGDIAAVDFEHFIEVTATSPDDRRIGLRLRRYRPGTHGTPAGTPRSTRSRSIGG